jgi:hypothetical protein
MDTVQYLSAGNEENHFHIPEGRRTRNAVDEALLNKPRTTFPAFKRARDFGGDQLTEENYTSVSERKTALGYRVA